MEFLLVDIGATLAFLVGYMAVVVLERRRAQVVTLARRTTSGLSSYVNPDRLIQLR
jgi:hypothetical protein